MLGRICKTKKECIEHNTLQKLSTHNLKCRTRKYYIHLLKYTKYYDIKQHIIVRYNYGPKH